MYKCNSFPEFLLKGILPSAEMYERGRAKSATNPSKKMQLQMCRMRGRQCWKGARLGSHRTQGCGQSTKWSESCGRPGGDLDQHDNSIMGLIIGPLRISYHSERSCYADGCVLAHIFFRIFYVQGTNRAGMCQRLPVC